jgi:hypothetical protein
MITKLSPLLLTFTTILPASHAQFPSQPQETPCYWPNGTPAENYLPCPNSRVCCLINESCLTNGLCYGSRYNLAYRGACTDSTWPEDECPHVCYTGPLHHSTFLHLFPVTIVDCLRRAADMILSFLGNAEVSSSFADIHPCPGNPRGFATCGPSGWVTEICEWNLSTFRWPPARVVAAQLVNVSSTSENETTGTGTTTVTVTASANPSANPDSNAEADADANPVTAASGGSRDCSATERRFGVQG